MFSLPPIAGYTIELVSTNQLGNFFNGDNIVHKLLKVHTSTFMTITCLGYSLCCIGLMIVIARNIKQCLKIF